MGEKLCGASKLLQGRFLSPRLEACEDAGAEVGEVPGLGCRIGNPVPDAWACKGGGKLGGARCVRFPWRLEAANQL